MKKFVSWRRISTWKQGAHGLGMAAQKDIIDYFVASEGGKLIADFEEVYTGKELRGCVQLHKAMEVAKKHDAILIIAKTDRFRNVLEALTIYEEMGDGKIMFCDLPTSDKFTLTIMFAVAEREALMISIRTKQALAQAKKRGAKLGGFRDGVHIANEASVKSKKEAAQNNPNNIRFRDLYAAYRLGNPPLRRITCGPFTELLRKQGCKTSSGLEFNDTRTWSMFCSLRRQKILVP